ETFHKILKSGCKAEESRLRTADRLVNLIAVFCILSWRIFWMTMLNRASSGMSAQAVFSKNRVPVARPSCSRSTSGLWRNKIALLLYREAGQTRRLPRPRRRSTTGQPSHVARTLPTDGYSTRIRGSQRCGELKAGRGVTSFQLPTNVRRLSHSACHGGFLRASRNRLSISFCSFRRRLILLWHSWATSSLTVLVVLLPSMNPVQR